MSIAWTTVAFLFLLVPGVAFFIGSRTLERMPDHLGAGTPVVLSLIVGAAILMHAVLFAASNSVCGTTIPCMQLDYIFALLQLEGAKAITLEALASNLKQFAWWVIGYAVATSFLAYFLGKLCGPYLLKIRGLQGSQHEWYNNLINEENAISVVAYVLTNISHEGKTLLYGGFLDEIHATKDGTLSYVLLSGVSCFYLDLTGTRPKTSPHGHWITITGDNDIEPSGEDIAINETTEGNQDLAGAGIRRYMLIEGEDIANTVFEIYELD